MRIDAHIVCPEVPDWAHAKVIDVDGKLLFITRKKARKVWPRWWHKVGQKLGWYWLQTYRGLDWKLKRRASDGRDEHG